MAGIRITISHEDGSYKFACEGLHPFEQVNPKFFNIALDILKENRAKIIGKISKEYYDKDYFEGVSEKSGLVGFDEMSKSYALEHAHDRVIKLMTMCGLDNKARILEIGCAFGHTVDALRDLGYEAYGVDISEYAINKYKKDYKFISDFGQINLVNRFNIIYGFNLMEHIPELDLRKFIGNIRTHLVDGGVTLLTIDPEWGSDTTHCTLHDRQWWDDLFESEGFAIHNDGTEVFRAINGHVYQKKGK